MSWAGLRYAGELPAGSATQKVQPLPQVFSRGLVLHSTAASGHKQCKAQVRKR